MWSLSSYIKDLNELKSIITRYNIEGDFTALERTIDDLSSNSKAFVDYKFQDLEFWINKPFKGTLPKEEHYTFIKIKCDNHVSLLHPLKVDEDSLHMFSLDIKIELKKSKRSLEPSRFSSWHLDKERTPENCRLSHPYYHFQFGGKKLEYLEEEMGLLSSPRIPHPPMEIILMFHFIINNFYDNKSFSFVKELLSDPDYLRIVSNSKKRIWDDYFKSFDKDNKHIHYNLKRTFPLYAN